MGSRKLRPLEDVGISGEGQQDDDYDEDDDDDDDPLYPEREINRLYSTNEIKFWPDNPDPQRPDPRLDELERILNPPSHQGDVVGTADERYLVYATGGANGGLKAIVLISFEPSLRLKGLKPWRGGAPWSQFDQGPPRGKPDADTDSTTPKGKGKGKETQRPPPPRVLPGEASSAQADSNLAQDHGYTAGGEDTRGWASTEPAMYGSIPCGFDFAL